MPKRKIKHKNITNSLILNPQNLSLITSIIKTMPGIIYWKDKEGRYFGGNDSMLKIAGMESIIGKTDFDMPWAETAAILRNYDQEVISLNSTLEIEEIITIANGQEMVLITRKTPLIDEQGHIIGCIGISLDITERKALEKLQKAKDKAELALESMKQTHLEEQKHRAELERLLLENTKHKAQLEAQNTLPKWHNKWYMTYARP